MTQRTPQPSESIALKRRDTEDSRAGEALLMMHAIETRLHTRIRGMETTGIEDGQGLPGVLRARTS